MNTSNYFSEVTDPRETGRCLPLLSDILMIGLCTYLTGGTDRKSTRLNSSHWKQSRMPSSA